MLAQTPPKNAACPATARNGALQPPRPLPLPLPRRLSLPLDGAGWLAGDVIHHTVDAAHLLVSVAGAGRGRGRATDVTTVQAGRRVCLQACVCGARPRPLNPSSHASSQWGACQRTKTAAHLVADARRHGPQELGREGVPVSRHAVAAAHRAQAHDVAVRALVPLRWRRQQARCVHVCAQWRALHTRSGSTPHAHLAHVHTLCGSMQPSHARAHALHRARPSAPARPPT